MNRLKNVNINLLIESARTWLWILRVLTQANDKIVIKIKVKVDIIYFCWRNMKLVLVK